MFPKYLLYSVFYLHFWNACRSDSVRIKSENLKHECPYPVLKRNGSDMAMDVVSFLRGIAEVKFNGAFEKLESKRYCKIKCINGEWVGPLCLVDGETDSSKDGRFYPMLQSCSTQIFHSKFVVSHRNKTITDVKHLSHNSVVQVRCKQFGVFKLIGDAHLVCYNGVWKHRIPTCIPTTSLTNFTDESAPPSVLAKVTAGSASIEPTGELAVYPGSTIHLECLFRRSAGEPEWSWTSTYRTYTTGWSINTEERDWKYRLSIFYVKPQDTGIYTCSTPRGLTHSIILNVIEVHCNVDKVLTNDPNLLIQIQGTRLGQSTTYQCREGFRLKGTSTVTCQASGVWSGNTPECVPIYCPEIDITNTTVKLIKQDISYGGTATFQCPSGYKLIGVANLVCLISGEWSGKIPTCEEVFCPPPLTTENLKLIYNSSITSFRVGTELIFSCAEMYKIVGKENIKCQESGVWSNPPPICKIFCSPPEAPARGSFVPRKIEYEIGDRISLICEKGFEPSVKARPKCLKNGFWFGINLECIDKKIIKFTEIRKPENVIIVQKQLTISTTLRPLAATVTEKPVTVDPSDIDNKTDIMKIEHQTENNENFVHDHFNLTEAPVNETDFFYVIEEQPF